MAIKEFIPIETGWETIQAGIAKLHCHLEDFSNKRELFTSEEYITLYSMVYNLCIQKSPHVKSPHNYPSQLYDKYRVAFEEYIMSTVLPSLKEKDGVIFLEDFVRKWSSHKIKVRFLARFFHYLDRFHIPKKYKKPLREVGVETFRDLVYQGVKDRVKDLVLAMIDQERDGEHIDRTLLHNVVEVYIELCMDNELDLYQIDLEEPIISSAANYYAIKASKHINEYSCPQYMLMAEHCLKREEEMASSLLHRDSKQKLLKEVRHELLFVHVNQLLEKESTGLKVLLQNSEIEHLSRMYWLYSKIERGLELAADIFRKHVTEEGLALIKFAEDAAIQKKVESKDAVGLKEQVLVRSLMELHERFLGYVHNYFKNDPIFQKVHREAFVVICNKDMAGNTSAEVLSTFVDNIFKTGGGSEKLSDDEIEETLEKVVVLVSYVYQKDIFMEFCRKKLSRRLLFDRCANVEHEGSFLTKLKREFGGQFTSKMQGMVMDMSLAREKQKQFEIYLEENCCENASIGLAVTVITTGFWPSYKSSNLQLPLEMANAVGNFKNYYRTANRRRKLTFVYSLGTCSLIGAFKARQIELIVSTYQAATLLLFNDSEKLSYQEIVSQLDLTDEDALRVLHSLSCSKYKILKKEPNCKTVSKDDMFEFNAEFTDKMRKIKVPLPIMDEKNKVIDDVNNDRKYTVDAAIVRIMKSKKVLNFRQLSLECVQQLKHQFKPDFKLIKKRVEDLIQRSYLEREEDNQNIFRYVA